MIERDVYVPRPDEPPELLAPVRAVLGADEIEVSTAGQLAAILAALPPGTPIRVSPYEAVDVRYDEAEQEDETVVVAYPVGLTPWKRGGRLVLAEQPPVPGLELGVCVVAEGQPLPERTRARCPHDRVVDALHAGDPAGMLDGCRQLVDDVAGWLARDDASLLEWTTDVPALHEQLQVESSRLAQAAQRLARLRDQLAALPNEGGTR